MAVVVIRATRGQNVEAGGGEAISLPNSPGAEC